MKKIMIAIHSLSFDGAEKVAAIWANYLVSSRYEVAFLVHNRREKEQMLNNHIKVYAIGNSKKDYLSMSAVRRMITARKITKTIKPDIIISMLPKMQILVMLATLGIRCKHFETIRNNPWLDTDVGRKRALWDACFLKSKRIIIQTEEQALYFTKQIQKKCVVIRNPILQIPAIKQYQEHLPKKFIAIGRISEQKNYPLMIRSFAQCAKKNNEIKLDIYGTGSASYVAKIQELIDRLGMQNNIKLNGWTDSGEKQLLSHDAFLMSSDYEGMPNALAEAMASGLVCLSTDCKTGPKDMIDSGKTGFLAKTGDEKSFAEGIEKITQMNMQQCIAMGTAAREKILTMCSEKNTLARLKQLIETEV